MKNLCLYLLASLLYSFSGFAEKPNILIEHAFKDNNNNYFVRFYYKPLSNPEFFERNVTFYGTSTELWQLNEAAFFGGFNKFTFSFTDPLEPKQVGIFQSQKLPAGTHSLTCDNQITDFQSLTHIEITHLQDKIESGELVLNSLPQDEYAPLYLFNHQNTYIFVDKQRYFSGKKSSYRLFAGTKKLMANIIINDVIDYFDNSVYFDLQDGSSLYIPAHDNEAPTWLNSNGEQKTLTFLETQTFPLSSLGIPGIPSTAKKLRTPCNF